jgi:hypothetical protein
MSGRGSRVRLPLNDISNRNNNGDDDDSSSSEKEEEIVAKVWFRPNDFSNRNNDDDDDDDSSSSEEEEEIVAKAQLPPNDISNRNNDDNGISSSEEQEQENSNPEADEMVAKAQELLGKYKDRQKKKRGPPSKPPPRKRQKKGPKPLLNLSCFKTIKAHYLLMLQPLPSYWVSEEELNLLHSARTTRRRRSKRIKNIGLRKLEGSKIASLEQDVTAAKRFKYFHWTFTAASWSSPGILEH